MPQHFEHLLRNVEMARRRWESLRPKSPTGVWKVLGLRSEPPSEEAKKAEAYVARLETQLTELKLRLPEFESFVHEVDVWALGKDPWDFMPPDAVKVLSSIIERGKTVFEDFTLYYAHKYLDYLETETLVALATADDRAYATMPEALRTLINRQYLLPASMWHQMFGRGVDIQGNAVVENEGNVMLLQLVYDDMIQWSFGDIGAYQFWIPPDDLAEGNWSSVRLTFECH